MKNLYKGAPKQKWSDCTAALFGHLFYKLGKKYWRIDLIKPEIFIFLATLPHIFKVLPLAMWPNPESSVQAEHWQKAESRRQKGTSHSGCCFIPMQNSSSCFTLLCFMKANPNKSFRLSNLYYQSVRQWTLHGRSINTSVVAREETRECDFICFGFLPQAIEFAVTILLP